MPRSLEVSQFGHTFTITFYNSELNQHHCIVCETRSVFDAEIAEVNSLDHLVLIHAAPAVVKFEVEA